MRRFSITRHYILPAALMAAVLLVLAMPCVSFGQANPFAYPTYTARTCSGQIAAPGMQVYVFGLKGKDKSCSARAIQANNYEEALECAKASCPDCRMLDITGTIRFGTAATELDPLEEFCRGD